MSLTINHNLMAANTARWLGSHYRELGTSVRRLSSGLRVGMAADDAAGLAARELMRADVASLNQGIRNTMDAISMIQTADGALQVIDEKLIRMRELAVQASTGTYNSEQRVIINSEFIAMAQEVDRIAKSTEFNEIKVLDRTDDTIIHFGTGNDSAEDYYSVEATDSTLQALGIATSLPSGIPNISQVFSEGQQYNNQTSGVVAIAFIPAGTQGVTITMSAHGTGASTPAVDDDIQLFTRNGDHLAGTDLTDYVWNINTLNAGNIDANFVTEANGFFPGAEYDATNLNAGGATYTTYPSNVTTPGGMSIAYSGDPDRNNPAEITLNDGITTAGNNEYMTIDNVTEDLLFFVVGNGSYSIQASYDSIPDFLEIDNVRYVSIQTQDNAQSSLPLIDQAIIKKDKVRAYFGAMQNRLQNTMTVLGIQAENTQAAESRISDADMALEMTNYVRRQILSQTAGAMLAQANALPKMALTLIQGG